MALIKQQQLDNGAIINYWRVDMISIDKSRGMITFALMGYHSKEIAELHPQKFLECIGVSNFDLDDRENCEALAAEVFNKYFSNMDENFKDIYTACYHYAKENVEFFMDAKDDEEEVVRKAQTLL